MFGKTCPRCGQPSYSSAPDRRHWLCPTCGLDLTLIEPRAVSFAAAPSDPKMIPPRRRLSLVRVAWRRVDEGAPRVEVLLRNTGGTEHLGVARTALPDDAPERLVAEATLRAIQNYVAEMGVELHLVVQTVQTVDHGAGQVVTVAIGSDDQTVPLAFAGAVQITDKPHVAVAKAVLQSLNRYLEQFLGWPGDLRTAHG